MKTFVLLMMVWTLSGHSAGSVASAEFATQSACEFAASQARIKFAGFQTSFYYVCVPKNDRP